MSDILTPSFIREELNKENVITLDFEYLTEKIEKWWFYRNITFSNHLLKLQLISLLLDNFKNEHIKYFDKLGRNYISAICITNVFSVDNYILALIVHEAMCEIFHLNDIKYNYEDHKALFLKPTGENYRDWGNGYGEITPHSDDLYEETPTDFLALTVCRDITKTPTSCYLPKDLLTNFNDDEISCMLDMKVKFISGKNVQIVKQLERNIIEYDKINGVRMFMDFRVDNHTGERMIAMNPKYQKIIDKMRDKILECKPIYSVPETGTFLIIANYKVLHARAILNMNKSLAREVSLNPNFNITPRLLYRSKGSRYDIAL
ncbi:MAG: hypothetical protein LW807_06715 [Proteobacteria bacterium]|jgi:hypothetical protein|nr:hypothetical protein [Pseudomonadota bacterium]